MSKLEEKVNEILGIERSWKSSQKEFKLAVDARKEDKQKTLITITNIVEKITII